MTSENENYHGARAADKTIEEPTQYRGRRIALPVETEENLKEAETYTVKPVELSASSAFELDNVENKLLPEVDFDEDVNLEEGEYYDPNSKLEGEREFKVVAPEGWDNEGTAFDLSKGRRKALIEGAYSTEIDGGIIENPKGNNYTKLILIISLVVGLIGSLAVWYFLINDTSQNEAPQNNLVNVLPQIFPETTPVVGSTKVTLGESDTFVSTKGPQLTSIVYTAEQSSTPCEIDLPGESCLTGTVNIDDYQSKIFYTNDLVNSKVFSEMLEFTEILSSEEQYIAQTVVQFTGEPTKFIIYANPTTGGGYYVQIPLETTADEVISLSRNFSFVG